MIGSIILMDTDVPGFGIALPLIGGIAIAGGAACWSALVWLFERARRRPVVTGAEQMLGEPSAWSSDFDGAGTVRLGGELWNARAARAGAAPASGCASSKVDGLLLEVEPL